MSIAIGSSRESNPSRRICHLRAVPLGHVADSVTDVTKTIFRVIFGPFTTNEETTFLKFQKKFSSLHPNNRMAADSKNASSLRSFPQSLLNFLLNIIWK